MVSENHPRNMQHFFKINKCLSHGQRAPAPFVQQVQDISPQSILISGNKTKQKRDGTVPANALLESVKDVRLFKLFMDSGMVPVKLPPLKLINVRAVRRPISVGIVPPLLKLALMASC